MSALDDPEYARFAWARYRRLLAGMIGAALLASIGALGLLWWMAGSLPFHVALATSLGVFFAVVLASALMGLVFLSSGSGHDATIEDPFAADWADESRPPSDQPR